MNDRHETEPRATPLMVTALITNTPEPLRVLTNEKGQVIIKTGMLTMILSREDAHTLGADIASAIQGLGGDPPAGPANEFTPAAVEDLMDAETVTTTDGEAG